MSALAILCGTGLSALLAPPSLVLASGVAFLLSEFADLAVYTPLARRRLVARRGRFERRRAGRRLRSCSCGSPSARSISCSGKWSARAGWCCCRSRSWPGCAAATSGSAWRRRDFLSARQAMSDALFDILRKVTTATITTMLLKKGIRRCWMNGPKPLVSNGERIIGPAFTLALRAGARRSGDAGKLGQPDLDPRRDRGDAGGRDRGRRRHGRAERRHLRRHSVRADEKAKCRGAGHRRRPARPRRRA